MKYTSEGQDPFYNITTAENAIAALMDMYHKKTSTKPDEPTSNYQPKSAVTPGDKTYGELEPSISSEESRDSILDELELLLGQ